jgi:hypothetical protein
MAQGLTPTWDIHRAVGRESECQSTAENENRAWQKFRERAAQSPQSIAKKLDMSWLCLPDTVDPRGPKGR